MEGGVGEEFVQAGHDQRGAGGVGAAEVDGVVVQRGLEVLPQPGDETIDEGGKLVARGFGEGGRGAAAFEVVGEVVVRDGAVAGIGQLLAEREGAALLRDGLGHVALFVEQIGEGTEHLCSPGRVVLEDLEAFLQLGLRLAEAAQSSQCNGAVHPGRGNVLCRALQRSLDLQTRHQCGAGRIPSRSGHGRLPWRCRAR